MKLTTGIFAHVDAGKTSLTEAMLYDAQAIRQLGRVDKGNAFLDPASLEKKRGITIYSHLAQFKYHDLAVNLLDTPGHVDFIAQTEQVIAALDYAILVVSATDGVTAYTQMIWQMLQEQGIPIFIFVNKMDVSADKKTLLQELTRNFGRRIVDFSDTDSGAFADHVAAVNDNLLLKYLSGKKITDELIRMLISARQLTPVYWGSALKNQGVSELLQGLAQWTVPAVEAEKEQFAARVFKISHDQKGNRWSWIKIVSGSLAAKSELKREKVNEIRSYNGTHFETVAAAQAGDVVAVSGLKKTYPGEGLGSACDISMKVRPVLSYTASSAQEGLLAALKIMADENPLLDLKYEAGTDEIKVALMGPIEIEVLKQLLKDQYGINAEFSEAEILYKETISAAIEAVGHFEPLRHYAEAHLLLEPGEPGSGVQIQSRISSRELAHNWQQQIINSLKSKRHLGILIGAPLTDLKITLVAGKGSQVHTVGGDFREASWRAVRQGLMELRDEGACELLEPWYDFRILVPENKMGRVANDIRQMGGNLSTPRNNSSGLIEFLGSAPVKSLRGYDETLRGYTSGTGQIELSYGGYQPCRDSGEVIARLGYDPERDKDNTPNSVFCSHGAGHTVNWRQVPQLAQCPFATKNKPL